MRGLVAKIGVLLLHHGSYETASLLRTMVLAALLGPAEFGIVSALALALRFAEMATDLATDRFVLQAKDGDTPALLASIHGIEILRGAVGGTLLAALAVPIAAAFGCADAAPAFALLGIAPLMRGLQHAELKQRGRHMRFAAAAMVEAGSAVAVALLAFPAAKMLGNYEAAVALFVLQPLLTTAGSHAVARQRYRVRLGRAELGRILAFGWPLLMNGLIMYLAFYADRILIGVAVPLEQFGRIALLLQIGLLPALIVSRVCNALFIARLAAERGKPQCFGRTWRTLCLLVGAAAAVYLLGFALAAEPAIALLFGAPPLSFAWIAWAISIALAIRILRAAVSAVGLALGDSRGLLIANLYRLGGLAVAGGAAAAGAEAVWIVAGGAAGEMAALVAGMARLAARSSVGLRPLSGAIGGVILAGALALAGPVPGLSAQATGVLLAPQVAAPLAALALLATVILLSRRRRPAGRASALTSVPE